MFDALPSPVLAGRRGGDVALLTDRRRGRRRRPGRRPTPRPLGRRRPARPGPPRAGPRRARRLRPRPRPASTPASIADRPTSSTPTPSAGCHEVVARPTTASTPGGATASFPPGRDRPARRLAARRPLTTDLVSRRDRAPPTSTSTRDRRRARAGPAANARPGRPARPSDDQRAQVSPLMSPLVWDLAHIGNYEELWLLREPRRPGPDRPRARRPLQRVRAPALGPARRCPILGPAEARDYLAPGPRRGARPARPIDLAPDAPRGACCIDGFVYGMVLQHEHQHDETMLATHQLRGDDAVPPPGRPTPPARLDRLRAEVRPADGRRCGGSAAARSTMGTSTSRGPTTTSAPPTPSSCPTS